MFCVYFKHKAILQKLHRNDYMTRMRYIIFLKEKFAAFQYAMFDYYK